MAKFKVSNFTNKVDSNHGLLHMQMFGFQVEAFRNSSARVFSTNGKVRATYRLQLDLDLSFVH